MSATQSLTLATAPISSSIASSEQPKVKPCCVCTDEKAARDECMLFSKSDNPQQDCQSMMSKYKSCMAGFGFQVA
ncbi:hypothetical protein BT63DRAFT_474748 [Microthyrium microscopicum]|uniref:Uncharacterized protein n=1 Tax=Microthyrium microscopicum TaxID=703497 RepID=A0A6A6UUD0_9PEZI|nr:hypothetical protein BT63DRAFT_474748 [Microthyrium microscopicum]